MGDELRELIKGFLARLETDPDTDYHTKSFEGEGEDAHTDTHWTTALRYCPRELLELVNSKACRGEFSVPCFFWWCRSIEHDIGGMKELLCSMIP